MAAVAADGKSEQGGTVIEAEKRWALRVRSARRACQLNSSESIFLLHIVLFLFGRQMFDRIAQGRAWHVVRMRI